MVFCVASALGCLARRRGHAGMCCWERWPHPGACPSRPTSLAGSRPVLGAERCGRGANPGGGGKAGHGR